jgi:hypothetical protein
MAMVPRNRVTFGARADESRCALLELSDLNAIRSENLEADVGVRGRHYPDNRIPGWPGVRLSGSWSHTASVG